MITKTDFEKYVLTFLRETRERKNIYFEPLWNYELGGIDSKNTYTVAAVRKDSGLIELNNGVKIDHTYFGNLSANSILSRFILKPILVNYNECKKKMYNRY